MTEQPNYSELNTYDHTITSVSSVLSKIKNIYKDSPKLRFLMGFDGYIDLLYNMVKTRKNLTEFELYDSMAEFGQKFVDTSGSSASIERVLKKRIGGGFAPNIARAVANFSPNHSVDLYAAMGYPEIDPLFKELPANVDLHSIGNSGVTLAMEFADGKIMSQDMGGIFELTQEKWVERCGGNDALIDAFEKADGIGNGHWSLMLSMNDYFRYFLSDVLPNISNSKKKLFFLDPADLKKRTKQDIRDLLDLLYKIDEYVPVVLSLNDREAIDIAGALKDKGVPQIEAKNHEHYVEAGININKITELSYLTIHDPHFSTITGNGSNPFHHWVSEGFTSNPKFTVAAGDHFNGAILVSILQGLTPSESIVIANAATAIFVRTGTSPPFNAIEKYVNNYFDYINNDIDDFEFPK